MRTSPAAVALLLVALPLAGCTSAEEPGAAPSSPPSSAPVPAPAPAPGRPGVAASPVCAEVRAGIDAFNDGDFEETVDRFEAAVPLAEEQADGSEASNQLVEAVRWYAELPAEDYLDASAGSDDFQRYKAITLGQCVDGAGVPVPTPSEPGVDT